MLLEDWQGIGPTVLNILLATTKLCLLSKSEMCTDMAKCVQCMAKAFPQSAIKFRRQGFFQLNVSVSTVGAVVSEIA